MLNRNLIEADCEGFIPAVSAALREHTAERSEILAGLISSFERDPRIRAAWLWGSFLRGEQDDLSDLDIWLLVPTECVAGFGGVVTSFCNGAGIVVFSGENAHNAPPGGGYLGALVAGSHGLHHLDIYWQAIDGCPIPDSPMLVNRLEEPCPVFCPASPFAAAEPSELEQYRRKIAFVWLMLSVAAKCLARNPSSDMSLLSYPRNSFEETVAWLGLQHSIGDVKWTTSDDPSSKVKLLRHIAEKTARLEVGCRSRGLELSPLANPCLARYFDLVEGILQSQDVGRLTV